MAGLRDLFAGLAESTPTAINAYQTARQQKLQQQQQAFQQGPEFQAKQQQDFIKGSDLNRQLQLMGVQSSPFKDEELLPFNQAKEALEYLKAQATGQQRIDLKQITTPVAQARLLSSIQHALPSNMSQSTVPGAASQVQLAATTGRALLADPNASPERIHAAVLDLARAIQRGAPQLDTIRGFSGYSNTVNTALNRIAERITSQPMSAHTPEIQNALRGMFDDLENSTRPAIERQMHQIRSVYGRSGQLPPGFDEMQRREMGLPQGIQLQPAIEDKKAALMQKLGLQ